MPSFVARRILLGVGVLFAAYIITFILFNVLPADAIAIKYASEQGAFTTEELDALREHYGIGGSFIAQFWAGLVNALKGDFGISIFHGESVTRLILDALPSTLQLTLFSLFGAVLLAAVVAIGASYATNNFFGSVLQALPSLFASVPTFLVGILFIQVFSFGFNLVPAIDNGTLVSLIGPVLALSIFSAAPLAQVFYLSLERVKQQPYVRVAEAKGAGPFFVFRRHVFRNAIAPVLTVLGLTFGELIAGSVITETIFARPGIGRLTLEAVVTQDYPVVQAVVLLAAFTYVVINLVVDLLYLKIDPRMRAGSDRKATFA